MISFMLSSCGSLSNKVPVGVVDESDGLTCLLDPGPCHHGQSSGQEPQVVVSTNEATIASKGCASSAEEQEFKFVPCDQESWLTAASCKLVTCQRVSAKYPIHLSNLIRSDLAELTSKSQTIKILIVALSLRYISPAG